MENFMASAMQVCCHYSERIANGHTLNEFEHQMYEAMAIMVCNYNKLQNLHIQASMRAGEQGLYEIEKKHQKWLEDNPQPPKAEEGE